MSSRRIFIKKTAVATAGIAIAPSLSFSQSNSFTSKLNIGLIGVGLRGTNHLTNLLQRDDVSITALCDIDPNRIAIAKEHLAKAGQKTPTVLSLIHI